MDRLPTPVLLSSLITPPLELYDLAKELDGEKNIADRHPDVIARINAYLQTARSDSTDWPLKAAGAKESPNK